ncbi:hypothetical protein BROUX41_002539 [Berkeleyomyces rouxiae]|uniref:uncharacterized protein n=1 Tax=Berkeleyomyces rouxiae TaxID=2035830 RepID=UPI003B7A6E10
MGSLTNGVLSSKTDNKFLSQPEDVAVVAMGFAGGQGKSGVDTGPGALFEAGLLDELSTDLGYNLHGDREARIYSQADPEADQPYRNMKKPRYVSDTTKEICEQVYNHAKEGRMLLTVGGDHSVAIGTIGGTAKAIRERFNGRRELAVVWVDAHADINTPETSDSGNIHGMPVAFLTGIAKSEDPNMFGWLGPEHMISPTKLVYIGLRDVDAGEKKILAENGIKAFSMYHVDKYGIGKVVEQALAHIGADTPIHLSFDIDGLDPIWAPATGTPVRGGLTMREGNYICEALHQTNCLVAMDLVEVNPDLKKSEDEGSSTLRAAKSLIRSALGDSLL